MDKFHGMASGTERAAAARENFGRGGMEMISFLRLGSEGLKELTEKAHEMGLVIGTQDVMAMKEFKIAAREMKEEEEAVELAFGKAAMPIKQWVAELKLSAIEVLMAAASWKAAAALMTNPAATLATFANMIHDNMQHVRDEIKKTALLTSSMGDEKLIPPAATAGVEKLPGRVLRLDGHPGSRCE